MPAFLNTHSKARARSVQLDKSAALETLALQSAANRESTGSPFPPSTRHSSLALSADLQENQSPSIRHYRSMLVVDAPTLPALGPVRPMDYAELYDYPWPPAFGRSSSRRPSQPVSELCMI